MIIINSEKDIEKVSLDLQQIIKYWWDRLNNDDPQIDTYFSDFPIGSLGEVWIAENEKEVIDKDFIEIVQINLKDSILFIGTWIPMDGRPCADVFISASILSSDVFHQFLLESDEFVEMEDF